MAPFVRISDTGTVALIIVASVLVVGIGTTLAIVLI